MSSAVPPGGGRRGPGALRWLLAGLLLMPVVEIAVAVAVARWIGAGWTVLALVALSVVGVMVLRRAARAAVGSLGPQVVVPDAAPAGPASRARGTDLALEVAGGVLLAVPGFVTAVLGALLVLPTRRVVRPLLGAAATRLVASAMRRGQIRYVTGEAVDVRVVEVENLEPDTDAGAGAQRADRQALPGDVVRGEVVERPDDEPPSRA